MSGDRKVSTDALETLGTIIGPEEKRDAIHLAVIPMQAKHNFRPGEHVDAAGNSANEGQGVGIVDPFIQGYVQKGEWFWLVIYPRKITSLRHVWSHPAFPEERDPDKLVVKEDREASERWLRYFCETADCPDYETVIATALDNDASWDKSEYLHFIGRSAHGEIPPKFWDHLEVVTGAKIPESSRSKYFSCSC